MNPNTLQSATGSRPILITGGCGFIGCNLADALVQRGYPVAIFDNLSRTGVHENAQWLKSRHGERITIDRGDVRDMNSLATAVRQAGAVLHLAAQVAVTTSLEYPVDDFEINARGTLNVLEVLRLTNPDAPLIFASTNKVYGELADRSAMRKAPSRYERTDAAGRQGIDASTPLDFYSPYGCSKGAADQYVRDYARVFGLRTAVLRMSCIYGPRQFGTEDQGWIAHFLVRAIHGQPITIYGDGRQVRDALYVSDAVAAWIAALDRIDDIRGQTLNLGGGPANTLSLIELLDAIAVLRGARPAVSYADWRPGDQLWYVSNISALEDRLQWRPQMPLTEGLAHLHDWLASRFDAAIAPQRAEIHA